MLETVDAYIGSINIHEYYQKFCMIGLLSFYLFKIYMPICEV